MTTPTPDGQYGPDRPCRRTACVEAAKRDLRDQLVEWIDADAGTANLDPLRQQIRDLTTGDHLGGAHLDPHDRVHYDGLSISYGAAPYAVKTATRELINHVDGFRPRGAHAVADSPLRSMIEVALDACFQEINRLRTQVSYAQADADRKVRDASRGALDCTDHGRTIADLERQLTHFEQARDRAEKARLALLAEHQAIADLVAAYEVTGRAGAAPLFDLPQLIELLRKAHTKTSRAHNRAYITRKDT
jgi:hypothetical protein